jgi:hypothetical protein
MRTRLILYFLATAILFAFHAPVRVLSSLFCRIRTLFVPGLFKSFFGS